MAISWRVEGAELGEEGLTPCAPVGWSGERVSVAQPAGPHELSGITWRPSGAEADEGIISQAIMHREGRLSLITNIDSARLMRAGVVARVMIRHQRLATCVIGPRSELHDPWLSKSWGASRWRDATPLASLERWVQLSSSPEGIHSTLGLARLGLPEQALKSSAPNGRALLRALVTSWLLHGSAARLGLGTWTLTPASKLPHWLGEPQVMVWRHAEGALEIKTRALLSATERLMRDVTQVARDLDATQGKRASRPREGSLTPKAAKGARRRPRLRPSPKPRRPPKPPKEDRLKRLKLKYD